MWTSILAWYTVTEDMLYGWDLSRQKLAKDISNVNNNCG